MRINFTRRSLCLAALSCLMGAADAAPPPPGTVLVLGDSLSAEYGLARDTGWVALLSQRLSQQHAGWRVVNGSISGETTSGGRTRLPALLEQHRPTIVIIELGANDAMRGQSLPKTRDNLKAMIAASRGVGAEVVLVGMMMPPNYGKRYSADFAALFQEVAQTERCALVPFLLKGIGDRPDARDWFQNDGIHPLAKAHPIMLDNVWPALKPLLLGREARAKVSH